MPAPIASAATPARIAASAVWDVRSGTCGFAADAGGASTEAGRAVLALADEGDTSVASLLAKGRAAGAMSVGSAVVPTVFAAVPVAVISRAASRMAAANSLPV